MKGTIFRITAAAAVMSLTLLLGSAVAFAAEIDSADEIDAPGDYTLASDIEGSAVLSDGTYTIDLNGNTWTGSLTIQGAAVTITDSSSDHSGLMTAAAVLFSYQLVAGQCPIKITITTLFIVALNSMFLGSIMLTVGLAFNRICSVVVATLIPMWSVIVYNMGYYARQRMSYTAPILWMGVADIGNRTYGMYILPPYKYIFMVLTGGIIGLSILSLFLIKRKDCNFENED